MVCCLNNIFPRKSLKDHKRGPVSSLWLLIHFQQLYPFLKKQPCKHHDSSQDGFKAAKRDAVSMSSVGAVRPSHTSQKILLTAVKCVSVSKWLSMVKILPYKESVIYFHRMDFIRMFRVTVQIYRISHTCIFLSSCSFKSHQEIFRNRAFSLQKALRCYFEWK